MKKENLKKEKLKKAGSVIVLLTAPALCFYLMEFMLRNPFEKMNIPLQFLNIYFFELFTLLLFYAFSSVKAAVGITAGISAFIGLGTYFVVSFRGLPVQPWDFFSLETAANVAGNYQYRLTGKVTGLLIGLILIIVLACLIKTKIRLRGWARLAGAVVCGALLVTATGYVQSQKAVKDFHIYDKLFTPLTMTYKDGTVVAFLMECQYLSVDRPEGYQEEEVENFLKEYETGETAEHRPNVIVIMNEAFSDLSILGDFTASEEVMPFVRGLMENGENTVSGYLDVSVLGGNTANTEFEFLTGDSMAFLPQGCIPYQQYISKETDSMASHLKKLGYQTVAMHPFKGNGWNRTAVYDYFGFDRFYTQEDFPDPKLIRKYISDEADFDKIIEIFEEKEEGTPLFLFNVTMQNHSPYSELYDNYTPEIDVEGIDDTGCEQYLSLVHESDAALEKLVEYFDSCGEDTVIVHFGDHQPADSVAAPIYRLNGKSISSLSEEELRLRYKVPYIIHANFDIEEKRDYSLSANFLGAETLQAAGIPLSPYQSYLMELQQQFASVSVMQTTTADGITESITETKDLLLPYQQLQYYHLFK